MKARRFTLPLCLSLRTGLHDELKGVESELELVMEERARTAWAARRPKQRIRAST
jgi:hypothetical protein